MNDIKKDWKMFFFPHFKRLLDDDQIHKPFFSQIALMVHYLRKKLNPTKNTRILKFDKLSFYNAK